MDRRWQQIEDLFHAAREVPPATRAAFLDGRCAGDEALRREVESLLARDAESNGPVDGPAWDGVGRLLESTPDLQIAPGTTLGPYRVTGVLGAGGMGQVYRADDARLGRSVAIKMSKERFTERFAREARTIAALNHPNICTVYDVGPNYLVLELVEGPTLADRIKKGPVPLREALDIARQIADALEAAHDAGIVHRDLKPANVKLRPDGTVKVLDFGLAKVDRPALAGADGAPSVVARTETGMIMGTAAYMAPEQARGEAVDKRADIWAFGVVFYEMLTGTRLFTGGSLSDVLASVLREEPDLSKVPPRVRRLIGSCLEKDPRTRLRDIGDALRLLPDETQEQPVVARRPAWLWPAGAGLVLVASVIAMVATLWLRKTPQPAAPETRLDVTTAATNDPRSFALSPDGRSLAYVATADGQSYLWVRQLATTTAQRLTMIEGGAAYPFWSPDSQTIGFFSNAKLKRIDAGGGSPLVVADAPSGRGGTWNADGIILFSPKPQSPVFRVSASGGDAVPVTTLVGGVVNHRFPQFLPDGRHFLFFLEGTPEGQPTANVLVTNVGAVCVGSLDSQNIKPLMKTEAGLSAALYMPPGWLLWVQAGKLVARRFDVGREELVGEFVTVADPVVADTSHARLFSVSSTGLVAYRSGAPSVELGWFNREGKAIGSLPTPDDNVRNAPSDPRVSPDGRGVAIARRIRDEYPDVWIMDEMHANRLTFGGGMGPIWSPDGRQILFHAERSGTRRFYTKPADGTQPEVPVADLTPNSETANDWSPDGRFIVFQTIDQPTGYDLWILPLDGDRTARLFLQTKYNEKFAHFSPDGRWVAYESNESGRPEIYIRAFQPAAGDAASAAGGQWQVSVAGGIFPAWRHDGEELYWIGPDGRMMAAPIAATETTLRPGVPIALFQTRINGGGLDLNTGGKQFDVAPDGRFLINTIVDDAATSITLLQNWKQRQ